MRSLVNEHREEIAALCRRYSVLRLDVFGSGATEEFDPQRSDLDFLVDFSGGVDLFRNYFGLKEALERLFGRDVDLVMVGAMKNPYFIASANKTRQPVYEAEVAQAAREEART